MEIKERVILLTGASGGLGTSMAKHFESQGYNLALHYFRHKPNIPESTRLKCYCADLRKTEEMDVMVEKVIMDFGRVDVLINNAGISRNGMSWKLDFEAWEDSIAINLTAPYYLSKRIIPMMRAQEYGRIINISSIVGQNGFIGTSAYAASKSGLFGLTKTLSKELAVFGITVNSLALGYFDEGMIRDVPEDLKQEIINQIPMKKLGNSTVIHRAIDFILDEKSTYFTGQILNLNGGLL
jgi:NAD(P)-dependent dehydrogenase (short-subunit alcohol dehydrogenase family)